MHLLVQLRKEGRRNEYERHKLQALNQRQKMVSSILLVAYLLININLLCISILIKALRHLLPCCHWHCLLVSHLRNQHIEQWNLQAARAIGKS